MGRLVGLSEEVSLLKTLPTALVNSITSAYLLPNYQYFPLKTLSWKKYARNPASWKENAGIRMKYKIKKDALEVWEPQAASTQLNGSPSKSSTSQLLGTQTNKSQFHQINLHLLVSMVWRELKGQGQRMCEHVSWSTLLRVGLWKLARAMRVSVYINVAYEVERYLLAFGLT